MSVSNVRNSLRQGDIFFNFCNGNSDTRGVHPLSGDLEYAIIHSGLVSSAALVGACAI